MTSSDTNEPTPGRRRIPATIVATGAAVGLMLGGLGIAAAQTDDSSSTDATTETTAAPADDNSADDNSADDSTAEAAETHQRADETPLTGDTAEKVKAAALAAVPGATVIRVETDAEGSPYEAHMKKSDGSEVTVKVNEAFEVTAVEEGHGGGKGGHGHHGGRPDDNDADDAETPAADGSTTG